jgi:capsular exopolysaccharide synthesis family protein
MEKSRIQKNNIFSKYDTNSPEAIEFRRIFSKVKNLNNSQQIKNVMITSSTNGEGKSTISTFLAITCSKYENGETLLIDCDLRRPNIHKILGIEKKTGLAEILRGEIEPLEAIKDSDSKNLKVITSGYANGNPTKLINMENLKNIFTQFQWIFQTIIIDSPPIIPVNDSLILNSLADTILMVVKAGKTQREVAKRAVELIQDAGAKNIGLLVNNINNVLPYYYNYKYYSKKYRYTKNSK